MRRPLLFVAAGVVLCAFVLSLTAVAGGFQLNEHGARAMARGGAFAANASDASAIFFNPAGLAFQKNGSILAGVTLIAPSATFWGPHNLGLNDEIKMESQIFNPINLYATYPLMEGLTAGVGVYNPYGLGTKWPKGWIGKNISEDIEVQTFYISPTIGYQVTDQLAIGVGFNVVLGSATFTRVSTAALSPEPRAELEFSGSAYGFNVGVMFKPTEELSLGATYRSEVTVEATGTAKFDPSYSVLPAGDISSKLPLPATALVGVAYKLMPELEIEADYQFVGWSAYKELAIEFKADPTKNTVSPKDYEDSYIVRVGAEYTVSDDLQLRAGYLSDRSPVKTEFVEPLLPDANRNGFNVGLGYKLADNIKLDLSYLLLLFEDRKAENTEVAFDGVYRNMANLLGINFGYTF